MAHQWGSTPSPDRPLGRRLGLVTIPPCGVIGAGAFKRRHINNRALAHQITEGMIRRGWQRVLRKIQGL